MIRVDIIKHSLSRSYHRCSYQSDAQQQQLINPTCPTSCEQNRKISLMCVEVFVYSAAAAGHLNVISYCRNQQNIFTDRSALIITATYY